MYFNDRVYFCSIEKIYKVDPRGMGWGQPPKYRKNSYSVAPHFEGLG